MNISTRERVRWALLLWCSLSISSLRRVNINLDSPYVEKEILAMDMTTAG